MITIIVGSGEGLSPFNIHYSSLSKMTSFLDHHPLPNDILEIVIDAKKADFGPEVKAEHNARESTVETLREDNPKPSTLTCHYYLPKVQRPEFEILVNFLYNTLPGIPTGLEESRVLVRAYVLAVRYQIEGLQNAIVDRFREFHQLVDFNVDIFAYLIGRFKRGDFDDCPDNKQLVRYFVEQIAYDIAVKGYEEFKKDNEFIHWFILEDTRRLRLELFKALAVHGRFTKRLPDPASLPGCHFHMHINGTSCTVELD